MTTWSESKPEVTDVVRDTATLLRAHKGSMDTWLQQTFYWSDSSASAGITRLSTVTGGVRAFVGAASALSSNETGTFFLASDTSRLYALTTASGVSGTVLVGSARMVAAFTTTKTPTDQRWLVQGGHEAANEGADALTFPVAYGAPPTLVLTPSSDDATDGFLAAASVVTAGGATIILARTGNSGGPDPGGGYYWRSEGTTTL